MAKITVFEGFYKPSGDSREKLIVRSKDRESCVKQLVSACPHDYCLDSPEDRISALMVRDFYTLGCGPKQFFIKEVECEDSIEMVIPSINPF
jgi:hypothetical protein